MSALGLHLKPNGFAAVEVETKKSKEPVKPSLIRWAYHQIPNFILDLEDSESLSHYTKILKEFIFNHDFESREIITNLPQDQVFIRTIKVPTMKEKELNNFIKYESEQYIPLPLEEVTLGYDVMDLDLAEEDKLSVLLVAAKRDTVEKYISIVKEANLVPRALEPESLSMTRSLAGDASADYAELIVQIGLKETLIILAYKGFVILTRNIPLGDISLTKGLSQALDINMSKAYEYKQAYGLDKEKVDGKVYDIIQPLFDRLISEIKRTRVFFTKQNPDVRINKIIVSGQAALMPGLLLYMVKNFDVEVELADPWINLNFDSLESSKDKIQDMGPVFPVPVGLALKVK